MNTKIVQHHTTTTKIHGKENTQKGEREKKSKKRGREHVTVTSECKTFISLFIFLFDSKWTELAMHVSLYTVG